MEFDVATMILIPVLCLGFFIFLHDGAVDGSFVRGISFFFIIVGLIWLLWIGASIIIHPADLSTAFRVVSRWLKF